jgi:hypothetical protein
LIFSEWSYSAYGYIGLGATPGCGELTPAFDNLEFEAYYSPVEVRSWGRIKSLYR